MFTSNVVAVQTSVVVVAIHSTRFSIAELLLRIQKEKMLLYMWALKNKKKHTILAEFRDPWINFTEEIRAETLCSFILTFYYTTKSD